VTEGLEIFLDASAVERTFVGAGVHLVLVGAFPFCWLFEGWPSPRTGRPPPLGKRRGRFPTSPCVGLSTGTQGREHSCIHHVLGYGLANFYLNIHRDYETRYAPPMYSLGPSFKVFLALDGRKERGKFTKVIRLTRPLYT